MIQLDLAVVTRSLLFGVRGSTMPIDRRQSPDMQRYSQHHSHSIAQNKPNPQRSTRQAIIQIDLQLANMDTTRAITL
jgi:hypothetical protein